MSCGSTNVMMGMCGKVGVYLGWRVGDARTKGRSAPPSTLAKRPTATPRLFVGLQVGKGWELSDTSPLRRQGRTHRS